MSKSRQKVNPKWFRHEALHTTNVCFEMIGSHLVDHAYYNSGINPAYNEQVDIALDALWKAYQAAGNPDDEEIEDKIKVPKD